MPESLKIERIMEKDVLTAPKSISALDAARLMSERGTGSLIVTSRNAPIGIFTERDLLQKVVLNHLDPAEVSLDKVMTSDLVFIESDKTLEDAHQEMLKRDFRHLIVRKNGRLAGMVSIRDLVRVREQVLEQRVREKTKELSATQEQLSDSLQMIQREMTTASKFQKYLINKRYPSVKNMRFSHVYEQAASLGGDFFEVVRIDSRHIGIFMADVMGHGITSAMIAIELKMYFDQLYPRQMVPGDVITRMNRRLIPMMPTAFFVAGFYGIIDTKTLELNYSQFGLPKPLILKKNSYRAITLPHGNVPLGIKENTKYITCTTKAKPGDSLLLFTDGGIEQKNPQGYFYGENRFVSTFKRFMKDGRNRVPHRLYKSVIDFADGEPINDDIAILLCNFLETE